MKKIINNLSCRRKYNSPIISIKHILLACVICRHLNNNNAKSITREITNVCLLILASKIYEMIPVV